MASFPVIAFVGGAVVLSAVSAAAVEAGRDHSALPDFSSIDSPWVATVQDYQPPASGFGPVAYDKAHPVMETTPNQFGVVRTTPMRLADLSNTNLKPWVVDYLRKANADVLAGKLRHTARANCMPGGVPQFLLYAGGFENLYFMQTPKEVLIIHQADVQIRHVYLNVSHSQHPAQSWYGESVGHYEGNELVVDTIGLNDKTALDSHYDVPHTTQLHVVERFRLTSGGQNLQVNFTVEDPGAFYAPWSGSVTYRHDRDRETLTEEPCAENNQVNMASYMGVPTAARADF